MSKEIRKVKLCRATNKRVKDVSMLRTEYVGSIKAFLYPRDREAINNAFKGGKNEYK